MIIQKYMFLMFDYLIISIWGLSAKQTAKKPDFSDYWKLVQYKQKTFFLLLFDSLFTVGICLRW